MLPPVLKTITISSPSTSLAADGQMAFFAKGDFSDDTSREVTSEVNWHSSNSQAVSMDNNGMAIGHSPGTATITATSKDTKSKATAKADITVKGPAPTGPIKEVDLSGLKKDLKSTSGVVKAALDAEKKMRDTAASGAVDLNKPEAAAAAMKLTPAAKNDLKQAWTPVEQSQLHLQNVFHQLEGASDALKTEQEALANLPKKMPDPSPDEENKAGEADDNRALAEHIVDFTNVVSILANSIKGISGLLAPGLLVGPNLIFSSDFMKDWIKGPTQELKVVEKELADVQTKVNDLIGALGKTAVQKVQDGILAVKRIQADLTAALQEYAKVLADYGKMVDSLSSGKDPAIPPQIGKTIGAIKLASQLSKDAQQTCHANSRLGQICGLSRTAQITGHCPH